MPEKFLESVPGDHPLVVALWCLLSLQTWVPAIVLAWELGHWGARLLSTLLGQGHRQKCVTRYHSGGCADKCRALLGEVISHGLKLGDRQVRQGRARVEGAVNAGPFSLRHQVSATKLWGCG